MRQNYIAAVHASRAGLSDLVGPSTIAYFDLTLAFETVPFVHTLFFLHCKYFHYHKYNCSLSSDFQCPVSTCKIVNSTIHLIVKSPVVLLLAYTHVGINMMKVTIKGSYLKYFGIKTYSGFIVLSLYFDCKYLQCICLLQKPWLQKESQEQTVGNITVSM